jgi:pimeloyl-ACP methyl ester carboxylesterase
MRAARSERVIILAVSDGTTVATHLAVRRPQQVAGLLVYDGQAKGVRSVDYPWGLTPEQYQRWADRLVRGWGGPINLEYVAPTHAQDERLRLWWAHMQRLASSPSAVKIIAVKIILEEFSRVPSGTGRFLIAAAHVRLAPRS